MTSLHFDSVPHELTQRPQWVLWLSEPRDGKRTKVPYSAVTDSRAACDRSETWTTFDHARLRFNEGGYDGLGFVFTSADPYVGVDLDKCRDPSSGTIEPWAQDVVSRLSTYTELSPSQTGLHLILQGKVPPGGHRKNRLEIYDRGRYFTVTGAHVPGTPYTIEDCSDGLKALHAEVFSGAKVNGTQPGLASHSGLHLGDDEVIARAHEAKNSDKFSRLFEGDISGYPSQSEADLALCQHLAFWTGRHASQMDRLFRRSELYREKWDEQHGEKTYGQRTITLACMHCVEVYAVPPSAPSITRTDQEIPTPILLSAPVLPTWPLDAMPDLLHAMVVAVAEDTETPPELAALAGMSVLATCCQRSFVIQPKPGYQEPLNLYTVAALESGSRKTAVMNHMTKPLRAKERELCEASKADILRAEAERENAKARIKALRARLAEGDCEDCEDLEKQIVELETTLPDVPTSPRLWVQDITPEKLSQTMADNGECMAILSDEGGIFDIMAGRYSNGTPNIDVFLQSHAGSPMRVDRGSRPPVIMNHPTLTIGLSPQPDVLRGLTQKTQFRGRGLLARFLYALPASTLGYRTLQGRPIPASVEAAYRDHLLALLAIEPPTNEYGEPVRFILQFDEPAYHEWEEFALSVEPHLRDGGSYEHIRDWAGKLPGAAARLAGVFHCAQHAMKDPWSQPVCLTTVCQALTIMAALSSHALAVFGMMGADPALEAAKKAWRWIEQQRRPTFTARECFQSLKGSFPRMAELEPAFEVLLERGYLFPSSESEAAVSKPGPRARTFRVNPMLMEGWS